MTSPVRVATRHPARPKLGGSAKQTLGAGLRAMATLAPPVTAAPKSDLQRPTTILIFATIGLLILLLVVLLSMVRRMGSAERRNADRKTPPDAWKEAGRRIVVDDPGGAGGEARRDG